MVVIRVIGEYQGSPLVHSLLGSQQTNLEGKEVRFAWAQTALWAVMTTATICGAVNGVHDSLMAPGGLSKLSNMFLQIIW